MTILSVEEQLAQGLAFDCEWCETGKEVLIEIKHGWATWRCLDCGQEGYSLEGDDE